MVNIHPNFDSDLFESIFKNSLDAIFITSHENTIDKIFYTNSAGEELFGYKKEEIYELSWNGLVDINDKQLHAFLSELSTEYRSTGEIKFIRKDGSKFIGGISTNVITRNGTKFRSFSVIRDITEAKKAEEDLCDSNIRYRNILNNIQDAYIRADKQGNIIMVSPSSARMYRYNSSNEMIGIPALSLYKNPEDRDNLQEELLKHGKVEDYESEALRKDNTHFLVSLNAQFHYDSNGNVQGTEAFVRDISERKRVEKSLSESEERLRLAQIRGNVGVWDWNKVTDELKFTPELEQLYGLDPGTIKTYQDWRDLTHPDDIEKIEVEREEKIANNEPFDLEFRIFHKSGDIRWLSARGGAIYNELGETIRVLGINTDITERKNADEELARSNADLQHFAYVASHDLREPLRMITSFLQLLERRYKDELDQDANEFINFAVEGAKRLDNMINDLLEYSKVANKERIFNQVNMEKVLDQTLINLKVQIDENNVIITHDALPTINGDEKLLVQLFQNIIGNAIKYRSKEPPEIYISAKKEKNQYLFMIRDNGIGMSPDYLDRIFTIFQRLHTKDEYEGTGIGLSIAQKIVHQHGGEIWVKSEQGKGSTFYFTISEK